MTIEGLPRLGDVRFALANSEEVLAMGAGIELRQDYGPDDLRALARHSKDTNQSRRLLAMAAVLDGHTRAEAATIGGMDRQTLRDWVHRFNGSGPEARARRG